MTAASSLTLQCRIERWPIAGAFTISRGAKTEAVTVVAEVADGTHRGRGECTPYPRYGETPEATRAAIKQMEAPLRAGLSRDDLQSAMPAGAARNALDCALLDWEAKQNDRRAWDLLGRAAPQPCVTAFTISLGSPDAMASAAAKASDRPLLKIKLGGLDDEACLAAVRRSAPRAQLIVDANEAWTEASLELNLHACAQAGVTLVEQPLPADQDDMLGRITRLVPICADESCHDRASLAALRGRYDAVNIKLDKTGGITEALAMADAARALGLDIMVGCMVATSLAMAPGLMLAESARYIDLDGPLLLAADRQHGLRYAGSTVYPPSAELWG